MSTIGQFDLAVIKYDGKSVVPFSPWVVLKLKRWNSAADGPPVISPHLMSEHEIDQHVAALKADLDAVSARAKRALRAAHEETQKLMQQRGKAENS